MKFNDDEIKDMDAIYDNTIKPTLDGLGYEGSFRVDRDFHRDQIVMRILANIRQSSLVIADLTYSNNGVYFELGYAQGLDRLIIRTCRSDWFHDRRVHFDNQQSRIFNRQSINEQSIAN